MSGVSDKLQEYLDRIYEAEKEENWDKVIAICREYTNVIRILRESTNATAQKQHYTMIVSTISVLRRIAEQAQKQDKINKDVDRRLNDAYVKINNFEKRLDKIEIEKLK